MLLSVPLNYLAIELFGGTAMHPDNLERDSLGAGMRCALRRRGDCRAGSRILHLLRLRVDLEARRSREWLAHVR